MPEPPYDRSWIQFDYWGTTGLGRHRVVDGEGNIVEGPRSWLKSPGVIALWSMIWLSAVAALWIVVEMVIWAAR